MNHQNTLHFCANQGTEPMMSFIVETGDGKVIVIDGGFETDDQYLLQSLQRITGQQKPHVDVWFLTHPHYDHTGALIQLLRTQPEAFSIGTLYLNFGSQQYYNNADPCGHIDRFLQVFPLVAGVSRTMTMGDVYDVGEARFEVLLTFDPTVKQDPYNNSSTVLRLTLAGQTVLFLADLTPQGGQRLLALYGNRLQSDFVQMAHHGQRGVEKEVYDAIAPKACLWPTTLPLWNNDAGLGFNTHVWKTTEVRQWMLQLGVEHHFVNFEGEHALVFPYFLD